MMNLYELPIHQTDHHGSVTGINVGINVTSLLIINLFDLSFMFSLCEASFFFKLLYVLYRCVILFRSKSRRVWWTELGWTDAATENGKMSLARPQLREDDPD